MMSIFLLERRPIKRLTITNYVERDACSAGCRLRMFWVYVICNAFQRRGDVQLEITKNMGLLSFQTSLRKSCINYYLVFQYCLPFSSVLGVKNIKVILFFVITSNWKFDIIPTFLKSWSGVKWWKRGEE